MRKHGKTIVLMMSVVVAVVCVATCFVGCNFSRNSEILNYLADQLALSMYMGDDAFGWNVYSINPEESYGYVKSGEAKWYSYSEINDEDIESVCQVLSLYKNLMRNINTSRLDANEMITYRALKNTVDTYLDFYGSPYAKDFTLIRGSYISNEGGYVADFSSTVENFTFRNEDDVKSLLEIVESTNEAFETYIEFARDRIAANYPLYDYTIIGMQEYLTDILELGEEYYLYDFIDNKIDGAEFLSDVKKQQYKAEYDSALTNSFMTGVRTLCEGLNAYKGRVTNTEKSYLAAYGAVGRAYYEWCFKSKTGMFGMSLSAVYDELVDAYLECIEQEEAVLEQIEGYKNTNKAVYDEFYEYADGEKVYLGLTDPKEIIVYLKTAAKSIVPDLKSEPQIDFKYMDETVEQISSALAYYLKSPLDEKNSVEHITLNGYEMANDPSDLLTTIAHEGYPGHLYAHVNSKELGLSLLASCNTSIAFSEGWSMYVELAILKHIADGTDSEALKLYCKYDANDIMARYINMVLLDMQANYFGLTVDDFVENGYEEERARNMVEALMENPSVYISYGYGMYVMNVLHSNAQTALGEAYNEVEFNGWLLSDGFGPTLERATEMTNEYIASKA